MWRVRGPGFGFLSLFGTIWVHWSGLEFCGMSISRFWLNLVNEGGWFDFWKLMGLGVFGLYGPIDSEKGMKPFLYALFYKSKGRLDPLLLLLSFCKKS